MEKTWRNSQWFRINNGFIIWWLVETYSFKGHFFFCCLDVVNFLKHLRLEITQTFMTSVRKNSWRFMKSITSYNKFNSKVVIKLGSCTSSDSWKSWKLLVAHRLGRTWAGRRRCPESHPSSGAGLWCPAGPGAKQRGFRTGQTNTRDVVFGLMTLLKKKKKRFSCFLTFLFMIVWWWLMIFHVFQMVKKWWFTSWKLKTHVMIWYVLMIFQLIKLVKQNMMFLFPCLV